jgi:hypothetical protein
MGELRTRMPFANLNGFDHDRKISAVPDLFTVDLVARYIAWKLGQGAAAGSNYNRANGITRDFLPVHQEY